MTMITIKHLTKTFSNPDGSKLQVLKDINCEISKGEHIISKWGRGRVIYRQAHEVRITTKDLIDIYIDGEQLPGSHFEMTMLPGALPLRLPPQRNE